MTKMRDRRPKIKPFKLRLKVGDTVVVRSGKFKGKTAKILATQPKVGTVTLEGLNVVTRHRKPTQQNPGAGAFEVHRPLAVSKVAIYDSTKKKASRIAYQLDKSKKVRIMTTSGKEIK